MKAVTLKASFALRHDDSGMFEDVELEIRPSEESGMVEIRAGCNLLRLTVLESEVVAAALKSVANEAA